MPTKKNISLKQADIDDIKELRSLIENNNERLSLAEVIRKSLDFAKKHHFVFQSDYRN